ncbi:hypothetical protein LUZ60_014987 [Juncus effusus]|nr:hypothetical protein LUZ60_014987 [Juncus effusus]
MENAWSRAKRALAQRLCITLPRAGDDVPRPSRVASSSVESHDSSISSPPASGSRSSSKKICAICLGVMRTGHGHALFTAQCSHTFHFHCISSNVKHGNYVCPICRAKWTEIPSHGPPPPPAEPNHSRSRVNPLIPPYEEPPLNFYPRVVRLDTPTRLHFHPPEPAIFNDDELVPLTPEIVNNNNPQNNANLQRVEVKTYPEFSAIPQSMSKENFNVLIHLTAPHAASPTENDGNSSRAPIDLVTVLDVSGSMAGTKLALLKRAMGFVIQHLGPNDRLSVVAFSSTARRLFPLTRMSGHGRQNALQSVNSLSASGGTNIAEGLRKAAKVIDDRSQKNSICSIILLSDGQDTYSISVNRARLADYQSLVPSSIVRPASNGRTPIHTFGFGMDHDSAAMHAIAEISCGTFSFIEAEAVIQDAFAQCIGGLLSVVVQGMRLSIQRSHREVVLTKIHSGNYSSEVVDRGRAGSIEVGDLYADEERDFLLTLKVPSINGEPGTTSLIKVSYTYKDPVTKEVVTLQGEEVTIKRPVTVISMPVLSVEVDRERNRVQAAEAMSVARVAAERGELSQAVSVLEERRRLLSESLAARDGDRLCVALDAEMREMQERMASRQRYEESGRAYMLSGLSAHWSQRATARGDSTDGDSVIHSYQTPSMVDMLQRSQTFLPPNRTAPAPTRPPVRPSRSFGGWHSHRL